MNPKLTQLGSNQCLINMDNCIFWFSYETCVAFHDRKAGVRVKRNQSYSRTTAKHMSQMGVKDFPEVSDEEFEKCVAAAMSSQ